ncbi:MAG: DUF1934 domain-containing protein [Clostridiales bacterium]|nr:DUF1934 domain-containing protein [Clostridiales bacterium]
MITINQIKRSVIINIVDRHELDGEDSQSQLITLGTLSGCGNDYCLEYEEQDEGLPGCITRIKVEDGKKIIMTRQGEISTEMVIEKGKRHNCHYTTPYGQLIMGVFARYIVSDMTCQGGELTFAYTLDYNTGLASYNELKVSVKEANDNVIVS